MPTLPDNHLPLIVECGDCWERFLTNYPTEGSKHIGCGYVICPECKRVCDTEDEGLWEEDAEDVTDGMYTIVPFFWNRPRTDVDANKKALLDNMGYRIEPCCGLCANGEFPSPSDMFGTCAVIQYPHAKHTGADRNLSVNRYGGKGCGKYEPNPGMLGRLGAFYEYYKE